MLKFLALVIVFFYFLNQLAKLSCQFFLLLSYLTEINNSFLVLLINTNFVFTDKSQVFFKFLCAGGKNLSDLVMACWAYVVAHLDDQLDVTTTLLE